MSTFEPEPVNAVLHGLILRRIDKPAPGCHEWDAVETLGGWTFYRCRTCKMEVKWPENPTAEKPADWQAIAHDNEAKIPQPQLPLRKHAVVHRPPR